MGYKELALFHSFLFSQLLMSWVDLWFGMSIVDDVVIYLSSIPGQSSLLPAFEDLFTGGR